MMRSSQLPEVGSLSTVEEKKESKLEAALLSSHHEEVSFAGRVCNLTLTSGKSAGKNNSKRDGFYKDDAGNEYFVKVPADKRELFTELFAGKVLTTLKESGLIPKEFHELLICADWVKFSDGTYGLIQPKKKIKEIWKFFNEQTSSDENKQEKDRNVLKEMFYGKRHYYPLLARLNAVDSLAAGVLYSLIIGDYSVHSGNMVYSEEGSKCQFSRIDFGAAFRHIGHPGSRDVMNPLEYHSYKGFTKGYHYLYAQVPKLYWTVAQQAQQILIHERCTDLPNLVYQAVQAIPSDLLNPIERAETAGYLNLPCFVNACAGNTDKNKIFAEKLAELLRARISGLAELPKTAPELMTVLEQKEGKDALPEQLTPNKMFDFALAKLKKAAAEHGTKASVELIPPTETCVYGARFTMPTGHSFVLTSPASDDKVIDNRNHGTRPLAEVLDKILLWQASHPQETYLVPLGECQPISSFIPDKFKDIFSRNHWTLLLIRNQAVYFFDSCSSSLIELSGSSIYSLEPLEKILASKEFKLQSTNYLGWQKDSVNCGRYVAEIATKAAINVLFSPTHHDLQTAIKGCLERPGQTPFLPQLVLESEACRMDRQLMEDKSFCEARSQAFLGEKLTGRALIRAGKGSTNRPLAAITESAGFETKGDGSVWTISNANVFFQGNEVKESVVSKEFLQRVLSCDSEMAEAILTLHRTDRQYLIANILTSGIKKSSIASCLAKVGTDEASLRIDLQGGAGEAPLLTYTHAHFSLLSADGVSLGAIEGPVAVFYQLIKKEGIWGWNLKEIKTKNADILRILNDESLPEQYIIDCYVPVTPAVSIRVDAQAPLLQASQSSSDQLSEILGKKTEETKPEVKEEEATSLKKEIKLQVEQLSSNYNEIFTRQTKELEETTIALQIARANEQQCREENTGLKQQILMLTTENTALQKQLAEEKSKGGHLLQRKNPHIAWAEPQKKSKWKLVIAGLFCLAGIAALATGVGALAGLLVMTTWLTWSLIGGGAALSVMSGGYGYKHYTHRPKPQSQITSVNLSPQVSPLNTIAISSVNSGRENKTAFSSSISLTRRGNSMFNPRANIGTDKTPELSSVSTFSPNP